MMMMYLRSIFSALALAAIAILLAACAIPPDPVRRKACGDGTFCPTDAACYADGAGSTCLRCEDLPLRGPAVMTWAQCGNGMLCPTRAECLGLGANCLRDTCGDGCNCVTGCGDGVTATERREECDDGNLIDGDGCDSNCRITDCGNGIKTGGEECDDGDVIDGDGCDGTCQREPRM